MSVLKRSFRNDNVISLVLFAAILLGYVLSGNRAPFDSALYLHTSLSIVREGNTDLNEYPDMIAQVWWPPDQVDGHRYDTAPIGTPVLAAPIMWLLDRAWPVLGWGDLQTYLQHNFPVVLQSLMASVIMALTAVLLYRLGRRWLTRPYALFLALIFAFGTTAWSVVSRTLWQHGPSMLLLTIALLIVLKAQEKPQRIQYVGLIVALAYVTRPTNSIAVLAYSLFVLLFYRKWLWRYLAWALVVAVPFIAYSWTTYHTLLPPYYRAFTLLSGATFFQALIGQWLSPSRGLLIFSPILLLAILGAVLKLKQRQWQRVDGLLISIIGLHWIVVSLWWNWWAGVSFGPRIWSDMLPYLIYFVIPALVALAALPRSQKRLALTGVGVLFAFSLFVHYRGANAAEVMDWNGAPAPIDSYPQRVWDWSDPQWLYGFNFGPPVDLAVSGIPYQQVIDSAVRSRLGTRNIQPRQYDAASSLIAPGGKAWYAIAETPPPAPEIAALLQNVPAPITGHTLADYPPYQLVQMDLAQRVEQAAQQSEQTTLNGNLPMKFGNTAELMGYQLEQANQTLTLVTYWHAGDQIVAPLKLFVHVLGPDGSIVAQEDRLDVPAELWHTGDWIVQIDRVSLPPDASPVTIAIGLYDPESNVRLPINLNGHASDQLLLTRLDLK
jgi:hypothetical protein